MAGLIGQIGVSVTHHVVMDPSYHQEYVITVCLVVKSAPETASACKIVLHIFVKVSYLYFHLLLPMLSLPFTTNVVPIWLFRIISIPSKFCYFRLPDHVISMD